MDMEKTKIAKGTNHENSSKFDIVMNRKIIDKFVNIGMKIFFIFKSLIDTGTINMERIKIISNTNLSIS